MTFIVSIFYFFLTFSSIQSSEANHLWQQIGSRLTIGNRSRHAALQMCTANALSKHGKHHAIIDQEFLQTIDSLHLFSQVLPRLAQNNLQYGYFGFAKNICQISSNLQELQKRREIIIYLQQNQELVKQLNELLRSLQSTEKDYLYNFYPKADTSDDQGFSGSPLARVMDFYLAFKKRIESNRYLSEYWQRTKQSMVIGAYALTAGYIADFSTCKEDTVESWKRYIKPAVGPDIAAKVVNGPGIATLLTGSTFIMSLANIINLSYAMKQDFDDVYRKQKSLMHIRKLINITEKISKLLITHPQLLQLMPELTIIRKFALYEKQQTLVSVSKMHRFLNLLHLKSFVGEPTYYFSWQGTIIETHTVYEEVKTEFVQLWEALGALDAQLCTQKLLKFDGGLFCLPIWTDSTEPILHMTNYWHPVINPQEAIKNNIELGGNTKPHNIVVTGANAGGKTTALTAIMIAQILAQSIGVAPASQFFATPFARLHTYLDITTNLEAHESLFIAQANRAENLYKSISSCTPGEKSLTILDEIFTGTRADFAENASFEFAQTLGSIPHSICLLATHFPKLTQLESLNLFVNYHAANATINQDGTLSYPYKIIPGISTQNIAEYILKYKGILKS